MYLANFKANNEKIISKKLDIKSLGNIPLNNNSEQLIIENNPKENIMKYIKDIRNNIIVLNKEPQVISIISSYTQEGKSLVAKNLAVALARKNKKVLLIDGNLRKASHKSLIVHSEEKSHGLTDFYRELDIENKLTNLKAFKKYVQKTQIPNLYMLSHGTITENTPEILKSKKMNILLDLLKEIYQYIILDGTSFFDNSDCIEWSSMVDTNILVIEKNRVRYKDLIEVKEQIEENNGNFLGFIINKTNPKHGKYYSKISNSKYGIFIDNMKEQQLKEESIDDLIKPIIEKYEEKEAVKFNILHKEIKDNILIEDFINDIESNFNLILENFKSTNQNNTDIVLEKINKTEENMQTFLNNYNNVRNEEVLKYQEFTQNIMSQLQLLKNEVADIKINSKIENDLYLKTILEEIQNKNYDNQFEDIKKFLQDIISNTQIKEKIIDSEDKKKKNNIIDLRKIFIENRKKNTQVFSIDEPIAFEDLERLAVEVIEFDETENVLDDINFK